jgi:glycosyltransferase involved in cell wall biosynthesis/peptidoglycan/xylan/chitin deacetylase (PgdA/CDA1 family)
MVKPFLPWRLRQVLRQLRGERRRKAFAAVWPINPAAGTPPPGWPGWPEGARFSFVLTHDVEGQKGYERVPLLMEIERKYGFRSSFNFVPKGEYRVVRQMLDLLKNAGFEAGIHGLEHDGKLYQSKEKFAAKAAQIRNILQSWECCGFRSPLMQHRLAWLHEIRSEYDASTFDVDPFEPQPDGMSTIFPFWVPGVDNSGFVELPYSLVQDFTLFKVLREQNINVWKKKLDWVAEKGGMALINTHPDYMCFDGGPKRDEFPVAYYEEFLRHVREKYGDTCWHALPREVSRYYCDKIPAADRNTRRKICMIANTGYEGDSRVRRYAETLVQRGDMVDVISLKIPMAEAGVTKLNGVTVHHIDSREKNGSSPWRYLIDNMSFLFRASATVTRLHAREHYDVIHVHNIPDFLVFAAWYPRLTGTRLILDIHDMLPELFENKFHSWFNGFYIAALRFVEKLSVRFVDHVIISNHLWRDKVTARSAAESCCSVIINHVDPRIFARQSRTRNGEKFIVLFPGSIQWHQGLDIAIHAFRQFRKKVPNAEFHLYCSGNEKLQSELRDLARELGLEESVKFCEVIPLDQIVKVIANADLGIVPKRADSFGNEAYSTKIMEFMSQGVPVVVSRTKIDSYYFEDDDVHFFPSGDSDAMAKAMCEVALDRTLRESLIAHGLKYVEQNSWTRKRKEYLDLIDNLVAEHFRDNQPKPGLAPAVED